jgi:hypothetical protein
MIKMSIHQTGMRGQPIVPTDELTRGEVAAVALEMNDATLRELLSSQSPDELVWRENKAGDALNLYCGTKRLRASVARRLLRISQRS